LRGCCKPTQCKLVTGGAGQSAGLLRDDGQSAGLFGDQPELCSHGDARGEPESALGAGGAAQRRSVNGQSELLGGTQPVWRVTVARVTQRSGGRSWEMTRGPGAAVLHITRRRWCWPPPQQRL